MKQCVEWDLGTWHEEEGSHSSLDLSLKLGVGLAY